MNITSEAPTTTNINEPNLELSKEPGRFLTLQTETSLDLYNL